MMMIMEEGENSIVKCDSGIKNVFYIFCPFFFFLLLYSFVRTGNKFGIPHG